MFLAGLLPHAAFGSRLQPDLQGARYLYFASLFACAALAAPFAAALASRGRAPRAVGLPDVATGAYVFRNAFPLALAFERGCSAEVRAGGEPRPGERVLRWDPATERWVERDAQR